MAAVRPKRAAPQAIAGEILSVHLLSGDVALGDRQRSLRVLPDAFRIAVSSDARCSG